MGEWYLCMNTPNIGMISVDTEQWKEDNKENLNWWLLCKYYSYQKIEKNEGKQTWKLKKT